ncbi:transcription factor TFIIIB component B'' homolog [Eupeodes corollae]|uniref:transcription factor TFIIIB component B'' homolog n=1 Tax=Eupeodes corollae TaxID=290404 RepID=UPI00248F51B1|nr:transcription factor TFIIIB component B'' homolog [Eupeodes corollae]
MSTRRPRIKAAANLALASKRKPKNNNLAAVVKPKEEPSDIKIKSSTEEELENTLKTTTVEETIAEEVVTENQVEVNECQPIPESIPLPEIPDSVEILSLAESSSIAEGNELIESTVTPSPLTLDNVTSPIVPDQYSYSSQPLEIPPLDSSSVESPEIIQNTSGKTLQSFEDAFKYPFNPDYKRSSAIIPPLEENTVSDLEDNILHMDLQKSPGFPMSPTKARQRIRPTPIFGQRRNSFVGTSPSPHTEDDSTGTTRQRSSNSTSSDISGNFLMRKLAAGNLGRIRTESGCSTISESRGSSRRNPNDEPNKSLKKEFQMRFNGGVPDKSTLKMFDLIYYNPLTNPMEKRPTGATQVSEKSTEEITGSEAKTAAGMTESAMPVPQLKLGSNGELMIDEMSLEIETTAEVEARKVLANTSLIYHDENTGGEGFYKRTKRTKDWSPDETIKFYRCLQTVGTDFSLMLTLFPNRKRRDLKLKFKKEERCNLNLINKALLYPGTFNIEDLKEQLDAEDRERLEQERLWKEIKAKEAKKKKKTTTPTSKTSRILASGDEAYQNENITKAKLSKRAPTKSKTKDSEPKEKRRKKNTKSVNDVKTELLDVELEELLGGSEVETMDSYAESDGGLNEASINLILNELANGTLALVSSEDLSNPNKTTVNEIYIMCKETKKLSDKPLDLPEDIVDAIKEAITS